MSRVHVQWSGQSADLWAENGTSLLDVLRQADIPVSAPCGGNGTCKKCRVLRTDSGGTTEVLACRTRLTQDCTLLVPETGCCAPAEETASAEQPCRSGYGAAVDLSLIHI